MIIGDKIPETEREPEWCCQFGIKGGVGGGTMADAGGGRELLEPRLGPEGSREKLVLILKYTICTILNLVF